MTPGLSRGPPFPSRATKGSIVAIASLERPSVPEVVGVCEIDVASLQKVQGAKGHAVRGQHWTRDELWAWSQGGKSGGNVPDAIEGWDTSYSASIPDDKVKNLTIKELSDDGEEGGVLLSQTTEDNTMGKRHNSFVEGEEAAPLEEAKLKGKEFSTKGKLPDYPRLYPSNVVTQRSTICFGTLSCLVFISSGIITNRTLTMV